ncbi:MAG: cytochrome c biogenesis protein CcsA [Phycisphaerales bacterium]
MTCLNLSKFGRRPWIALSLVLGAGILAAVGGRAIAQTPGSPMPNTGAHAGAPTQAMVDGFAAQIDVKPLADLAVHAEGRVVSVGSYTTQMMRFVSGPRWINGQSPTFTYFDLMIRPERYGNRPVIFVKKKLIRAEIERELRTAGRVQIDQLKRNPSRSISPAQESAFFAELDSQMVQFMEYGLISPRLINDPAVQQRLQLLSTDLLRTAKPVQEIRSAMTVRDPGFLRGKLEVLPPPSGDYHDRWHTLDELAAASADDPEYAGLDPALKADLRSAWTGLASAWGRSDAGATNAAIARLAELLPLVNDDAAIYPDQRRLQLENWYSRSRHMTWIWIVYGLALIPLTLFVVFRWSGALWAGISLFTVALLLQTAAFAIRWYVSGRFPNSNMFEAVTTAAWFGSAFAALAELGLRRTPTKGLWAIGSGTASMVALMAAYYLPLQLDPTVNNRMPVLLDLWLYIHTNVIIFSYCLVFMSAVTATLYLAYRLIRWLQGADGLAKVEYAKVGGAASLIMTGPDGNTMLDRPKTTIGQVLDGTTMILVELSFVLLWAGLVMGAIWADHSWGRPWGWDPKEVFALNTFIVFAVLIHARLKTKDKGLWTAIIALIGCAVMIFNWVVINFTIAGLHSYA